MKLRVTAAASSYIKLHGPQSFSYGTFTFNVITNEEMKMKEMSIDIPVADYEKHVPSLRTVRKGLHNIDMKKSTLYNDMVELLQYIESLGSFWLGIEKIGWEDATFRWVPDSDEESKHAHLNEFQFKSDHPDPSGISAETKIIGGLVEKRKDLAYLSIPVSFYREGVNAYRHLNYVIAFFHFFLFMEGLFGNGKHKKRALVEEFMKSKILYDAIEETYASIKGDSHGKWLHSVLNEKSLDYNVEGIINYIIDQRGAFFHFSVKDPRQRGHSLNRMLFQKHAFLLMSICMHVVTRVITGNELIYPSA